MSRLRPPPRSTLFPYTTLFRSVRARASCAYPPLASYSARLVVASARTISRISAAGIEHEPRGVRGERSEEHTSELQSHVNIVCRLLLEEKNEKSKSEVYTDDTR